MAKIKVYVPLNFQPPGTKTSLSQFLAGLQQAFQTWSAACNVQWQLVQSPRLQYYLCPVKFTIVNNPNFVAMITQYSKGRGVINVSKAANKIIQWDTYPDMSYRVAIHELGHILGLNDWEKGNHPNSIMNLYGPRPDKPGQEDVIRVQKIWGQPKK